MHWLAVLLGLTEGQWYNFWSVVGDLPLLGIALGFYRHHNCHVHGCWRIGLRRVEGTEHIVCRTHHPAEHGPHLTAQDIADQACEANAAGLTGTPPARGAL